MSKTILVPYTQHELAQYQCIGQPFPSIQPVPVTYMIPISEPVDYVYRVLRPKELEKADITAKDPFSDIGVAYHVAWGSNKGMMKDSRFISTCLNLDDAEHIAGINNKDSGHIVEINLRNWKTENNITDVICVFDSQVRQNIINSEKPDGLTEYRFHQFANAHNEVLLVGNVPSDKIKIVVYNIEDIL